MSSEHPPSLEQRLRGALSDRYELERELTGGGMSRVFVARELSLQRRVVIKVLPPDLTAEVNRGRFRQEVQFAARLQHPHIVPLLSAAEDGDLLYYTMPFIDGESLKGEIASGRRFTEGEVIDVLIDVADALAYAHGEGIVHRDIKPANILRSGSHAVVTDFGVAKALTAALRTHTSGGITTTGVAIGTPAYMAPEQIAGDPSADHRVDIYALGLLAYELLTGRAPFSGPSPQAMMAAQLTGVAEPLSVPRPDVSPALAALVQRCLEKDARRRPASAAAVVEVLRTIAVSSGTHLTRARHVVRLLPTAVALAVVGTLVTLAWFASGGARGSGEPPVAAADSVARAESLAAAQAAVQAAESSAREAEAAQLKRVTDSVASAVGRRVLDSVARQLGRASQPQALPALALPPESLPPNSPALLTPEAFQARALNMGPPRRVFVEISGSSMLRSPDVVLRAGVVRDSIIQRLRTSSRFVPIGTDTVQAALARTRTFDSLSVLLGTDLFVSVRTLQSRADSVQWSIDVRDLGAHPTYLSRTATARSPGVDGGLVFDIPALVNSVVRQLAEVDRAPRRVRE